MKTRKKIKKSKQKEFTKEIFEILNKNPNYEFNWKQMAGKLDLTSTEDRNLLIKSLEKLRNKGKLELIERGKYKMAVPNHYHQGIVDITSNGSAYVICSDFEEDIFIPSNMINQALHGDLVEIYVFPRRKNGRRIEGEITKIIERKRNTFVGIVQMQKNFAFVLPTDRRMYTDIFLSKNDFNGAKDGDKVLVRIKEWTNKSSSPYGVVEKILGKPGEHHTEIHSILAEYGLPYEFPHEVEAFAKQLNTSITSEEIAKRTDMRKALTFTIDPKDAKDFDDALSFEILENGNYQIGVHIADVSHYVQEGTILDDEAFNRATSIYLVDRVVPMLPEVLSNFACSLRPNEEKYTFSAVFELDKEAQIIDSWFGRTITISDARFAYEEAQTIIEQVENSSSISDFQMPEQVSIREEGSYMVSKNIVQAILTLNDLAKKLRSKRMALGAISFDKLEVKFHLDENNNPLGVYTKQSKEAHKLIEEFMLLANRKVAEFISKQKKTFVYRIHDEPDEEKLMQMQGVISRFGYQINLKDRKTISHSINHLLEEVKGKKEQNLVDTLAVRSMSKASYSTHNIGHYGLAFTHYTHFTSPIRRYPDVMVHRLLQYYLDGGASVDESVYETKCKHSSQMENLATNAERDSIKYMQVKYMQEHKDQVFLGVISGVTEWGIYVEIIENKCEGMIRARDLKDDYYVFDEKQYALVGEVTHKMYQLGDEISVRVKNTDLIKKHLDFELV